MAAAEVTVAAPPGERAARAEDNRAYVRFLLALLQPRFSEDLEASVRCPRCGR